MEDIKILKKLNEYTSEVIEMIISGDIDGLTEDDLRDIIFVKFLKAYQLNGKEAD